MYKVTNRSSDVVGLLIKSGGKEKQVNLYPRKSMIVDKVTDQIYRLADPSLKVLSIQGVK